MSHERAENDTKVVNDEEINPILSTVIAGNFVRVTAFDFALSDVN